MHWEETEKDVFQLTLSKELEDVYNQTVPEFCAKQSPVTFELRKSTIRTGYSKRRAIYMPEWDAKSFLQQLLPPLYETFHKLETSKVAYGFLPNRGCVEQALQHTDFKYTISLDIKDFFDHIRPRHVKGLIDEGLLALLFVEGAPRQGLPTSPIISNIAFNALDQEICTFLKSLEDTDDVFNWLSRSHCYTRYADDLSISVNDKSKVDRIIVGVDKILAQSGFQLNAKKTKLLSARDGRRIICGVGVDSSGIYPTRKTLKKIRASRHQGKFASLLGLHAWVSSIDKKRP